MPWLGLLDMIKHCYQIASKKYDRPTYSLIIVLRTNLMRRWYSFRYSGVEEALISLFILHRLPGIGLVSDHIPDETRMLTFRHLLEQTELGKQIFETLKDHLKKQGMVMERPRSLIPP